MKGIWARLREWLKALASIGDFVETAWLILLVAAIVVGGLVLLGGNLLEWIR